MKKLLIALVAALALFLPAASAQAGIRNEITVLAPESCGSTPGTLFHCVYGEVGYTGTLDSQGRFWMPVVLPASMAFPKMHYTVQLTSAWNVTNPPVECKLTKQPVSPTSFMIAGVGCTFVPFAVDYEIKGY